MARKPFIFLAFAAVVLTGCAGRPFSVAGAVCAERETESGTVRICETANHVTVEGGEPIVARDPDPRILGLTEGAAADRIIASARRGRAGSCSVDRRALRAMLARHIARKLLADL